MARIRLLPLLVLPVVVASMGIIPVAAQQPPQLIPFPADVKPGGVLYLAGGGFPAGKPLTVTLVCENWMQSFYGRWDYTLASDRIADGSFAAWKLHAGYPLTTSQVKCTFYAPDGDNPYGVSTQITIWPSDAQLQDVHIPIGFRVQPLVSSGYQTATVTKAAPGAHLSFTVHYPKMKVQSFSVRADWTGQASARWPVPESVKIGSRARVVVNGRLGSFVGSSSRTVLIRR